MRTISTRFLPSLCVAAAAAAILAAAPVPRTIDLAFAPEEGLVLEKHATFHAELNLDDMTVEVNGEQMDFEPPDVTNSTRGDLTLTDTYVQVRDGRVQRLDRSFDAATQNNSVEGTPEGQGDKDEDLESKLVGATVVFRWNEDDEEYVAAFDEDSAESFDADLLEDLDWDLDYAGLLPNGAVEEGESWTIDAEAMGIAMSLGGDLHFDDEEDSAGEKLIDEALDDNLAGEATLTFTGMRDVDGRSLAVITVSFEGEGTASGEDSQELGDDGPTMNVEREASVELSLEGELLWDAAAGHFSLLDVHGRLRLELTETGTVSAPQGEFTQSTVTALAGPITIQVTAAAP